MRENSELEKNKGELSLSHVFSMNVLICATNCNHKVYFWRAYEKPKTRREFARLSICKIFLEKTTFPHFYLLFPCNEISTLWDPTEIK